MVIVDPRGVPMMLDVAEAADPIILDDAEAAEEPWWTHIVLFEHWRYVCSDCPNLQFVFDDAEQRYRCSACASPNVGYIAD